ISLGLRHFFTVERHHARMHIVFGELLSGPDPALCRRHLMVWEGQIAAAALDVEVRAEILQGYGGTFDMPARPAASERTIPCRLAGYFGLPQQTIKGIVFAGSFEITAAICKHLKHGRAIETRNRSELIVVPDPEVQIIVHPIHGPGGLELLDQVDDQID